MEIFAALRGERASRRMRQAADIVYVAAVTLAGALLFTIDVTQPRGVVDGVGYSAVVALTSRFGRTALLGAAVRVWGSSSAVSMSSMAATKSRASIAR